MAGPKNRRHHLRCSSGRLPRMHVCWLLIISLVLVLGDNNNNKQLKLTYLWKEKTLRLECPREEGLLASYLTRLSTVPGKKTALVETGWSLSNPRGESKLKHDRVTVDSNHSDQLVAELSHVTCFDSATYECLNTVEGPPTDFVQYRSAFMYTGDISKPHITQEKLQVRYKEGEDLRLTCSANIGASANNSIVWEVKRKNESVYTPVTVDTFPDAIVEKEVLDQSSACSKHSTRVLQYRLSKDDDGVMIQCRLQNSDNLSHIIVAMQCRDGNHVHPGAAGTIRPTTNARSVVTSLLDNPRAEHVKGGGVEEGASSSSPKSDLTLVIIVVATVVVVTLVLLAMALFMRRWQKRQMRPLVVMDTPDSSQYGGGGWYADRQLPHLPNLSMLDHHHHHRQHGPSSSTFNDTLSTSRYVDSPLPSTTVHSSTLPADDQNVSIYVSMTGLDTLQSAKDLQHEGKGFEGKGSEPRSFADGPASMGMSEYDNNLGPDMRENRSESIYSNQYQGRTNTRSLHSNSSSDAKSVDVDEVTRLKIVD